mmetsp:Transcript_23748/g.59917  ORF Transcript_23748/g.59917 Transcript_23748/m.59917 type:complete len:281 (-) Transcript_23748:222-1064(-)
MRGSLYTCARASMRTVLAKAAHTPAAFCLSRLLPAHHSSPTSIPTVKAVPNAKVIAEIESRLKHLSRRRVTKTTKGKAAVLVPLCYDGEELSFLFQTRSDHVGSHRGQVGFPGGKVDVTDRDIVHTALRECHEELGIHDSHVKVLGLFHDAISITNLTVTPVIGLVGYKRSSATSSPHSSSTLDDDGGFLCRPLRERQLSLSPEVSDVFILPLSSLLDPSKRGIDELGKRGRIPYFTAGPEKVWGLTAYILNELLDTVVVPAVNAAYPQLRPLPTSKAAE